MKKPLHESYPHNSFETDDPLDKFFWDITNSGNVAMYINWWNQQYPLDLCIQGENQLWKRRKKLVKQFNSEL